MTHPLSFLSVFLVAIAACGGSAHKGSAAVPGGDPCAPAATNPCAPAATNPCAPAANNPCTDDGAGASFSDWRDMVKITPKPFASKGHGKKWVDVYVDANIEAAFRAATGPYPVGARIVKVQYNDDSGSSIANLTVMAKMKAGYDKDHGDWYYGIFDPSGTRATKEGKIKSCINCHVQAEDRDYVFGIPK